MRSAGGPIALFLAVVAAILGGMIGKQKAIELKLQPETPLCQAQSR